MGATNHERRMTEAVKKFEAIFEPLTEHERLVAEWFLAEGVIQAAKLAGCEVIEKIAQPTVAVKE